LTQTNGPEGALPLPRSVAYRSSPAALPPFVLAGPLWFGLAGAWLSAHYQNIYQNMMSSTTVRLNTATD